MVSFPSFCERLASCRSITIECLHPGGGQASLPAHAAQGRFGAFEPRVMLLSIIIIIIIIITTTTKTTTMIIDGRFGAFEPQVMLLSIIIIIIIITTKQQQ